MCLWKNLNKDKYESADADIRVNKQYLHFRDPLLSCDYVWLSCGHVLTRESKELIEINLNRKKD